MEGCESRFHADIAANVTAAVVGISRERWDYAPDSMPEHEARAMMCDRRYDVLPIHSDDGVREYYRTTEWDTYDSIHRDQISQDELISADTPIREVVGGSAEDGRRWYFLECDTQVVGLVSIVNLNSLPFQTYLYTFLNEYEMLLGQFLMDNGAGPGLQENILKLTDRDGKPTEPRKQYEADRDNGVDAAPVAYLQLPHFRDAVCKLNLHLKLGYSKKEKQQFQDDFQTIYDLRNHVDHRIRSLRGTGSVEELWGRIQCLEKAISQLRGVIN